MRRELLQSPNPNLLPNLKPSLTSTLFHQFLHTGGLGLSSLHGALATSDSSAWAQMFFTKFKSQSVAFGPKNKLLLASLAALALASRPLLLVVFILYLSMRRELCVIPIYRY
jgi:hypothetical protein